MAGTKNGGIAASIRNKELYGEDFYRRIGSKGGKKSTTGGFYANRELARTAGAIGGRKSHRSHFLDIEGVDSFIAFYNDAENVQQVVDKYNVSYQHLYKTTWRLRKQGYKIKYFQRKRNEHTS